MNEAKPSLTPAAERSPLRRPFRSLRWRLQAWHALVLTGVLTVFGLVVYVLAWQSRLQQIDSELDRTAVVIASRLRRLLPPFPWTQPPRGPGADHWQPLARPENEFANRTEPGSQRRDEPNGRADRGSSRREEMFGRPDRSERRPRPREDSDSGPVSALSPINASREPGSSREPIPGRGPRPGDWSAPSLELPEDFLHLFQGDEDSRLHFVIWDREGKVLQKSDSALDIPFPGLHVGEDKLPVRIVRVRDGQREVIHVSSWDINVLVGRSMVKDLAAQHASGVLLALAGVAVLAAGLVGGWWLSSRAIRPLAAMTEAAESISAQRLSQRIDIQETDTELGQLATVFNRTFDRLQAAFEQQTRFTADASHELRTPLSVILAHADLALSRPRSPDEYRATLETCRSASRRMKVLIDGLLTLARFDSDAAGLQFTEFDLEPVVRECIDLVRPLAAERHVTIEATLASAMMRGDRERLAQVITNLLTNAIRYNRDGGKVHVTVACDAGATVISVADTGIGISADDLPHVFDRFYRADKARSRAEGSSGLGLSISRTIVMAHGGTLAARSQPDVGTTMEVRLPLESPVTSGATVDSPLRSRSVDHLPSEELSV